MDAIFNAISCRVDVKILAITAIVWPVKSCALRKARSEKSILFRKIISGSVKEFTDQKEAKI